jgi:thiol-disulfide isomerase/thioredoxin
MKRRRLLGWALAVAAVIALAVVGLSSDHSSAERPAPALPGERLVGPAVTLASLREGAGADGSLIVFWASWCVPCAQEAPAIERFATSVQGRGRVVGVDWSDPSVASARAFIRHHGWTFPVLRDGEGLVGNEYRLRVLPTTFVLDGKGRIRAVLPGPQGEASLERALKAVA